MQILIAILVFGVIIAIHELGHFTVAKLCGIQVNRFAIGMGPAIFKFTKGETEYSLRILPIGGFCEMEGEDKTSTNERAFGKKPVWARILVISAGAIMNLILGFVLILILISANYSKINTNVISQFDINSSSYKSGLQAGDEIISINGMIAFTDEDVYYKIVSNSGNTFDLVVKRNGEKIELDDVEFYSYYYFQNVDVKDALKYGPYYRYDSASMDFVMVDSVDTSLKSLFYYDAELDDYVNANFYEDAENVVTDVQKVEDSIDFYVVSEEKTPLSVLSYSIRRTATIGQLIWSSLFDLIGGKYSLNDMSGPVGVVNVIGETIDSAATFKENLSMVMNISIFITINVGIFNLLPLPALDGGRLVFLIVEAIRRKPINPEREGMVHFIGLAALMILMLVLTFNDIRNIIQ